MLDREALLRAVCAAPDDDAPRLVYADWLEETGEPANIARAEFIRLQCELAPLHWKDERAAPLRQRTGELFKEHGAVWLAELPKLKGVIWGQYPLRGFINAATVQRCGHFRRHAETMFDAVPLSILQIDALNAETCRELAACPLLERVRTLVLARHTVGDQGASALATSPFLAKLRWLNLSQWQPVPLYQLVGDAGALALAASPHFRALERLNITQSRITERGAQALRERFGRNVLL